jgi:hypothetical protein
MFFRKNIKKIIQKEQSGIIKRYLHQRENWMHHLEQTRNFIQQKLEPIDAKSVAVLGSGWLLDIPVEFLVEKFQRIYLVDLAHPPQILKKWENLSAIAFLELDVTARFHQLQLKSFGTSAPEWPFEADVIISANLLSQLAELPLDYIDKRLSNNILAEIQKQHLTKLSASRYSILITDVAEIQYNGNGNTRKELIFAELPIKSPEKKWVWHFESGKSGKTEREVWAFSFKNEFCGK